MPSDRNEQRNFREGIPRSRSAAAGLLLWMFGAMLLGWFLMDGPGISTLVKRTAVLKEAQQGLRQTWGQPAEDASKTPVSSAEEWRP